MRRQVRMGLLLCLVSLALLACGLQSQSATQKGVDFGTLEVTNSWKTRYATGFSVDEYGKYTLLSVKDGERYLVVPEGEMVPSGLDEDVVVLQQPLDKTYLLSTPVADMLDTLGVLNQVRMTGTKEKDWYVSSMKEALNKGDIIFAGKYNKPDYELVLSEGCNLALENTMILHNPEAKEKLESLGIPVFIERSSYEPHPLGRLEWIKVYGLLYDRVEEANAFFDAQVAGIESVIEKEKTNQSVAFFYMTTNGAANVHKPSSYIAQMIELAGGNYALNSIIDDEENALSTMNMQLEDFYAAARDADVLIYNSTIVGELNSLEDLLDKSELFKDFKAVKSGQVYCTSNNFFQQSTKLCDFIDDVNLVLENGSDSSCHFLIQLR